MKSNSSTKYYQLQITNQNLKDARSVKTLDIQRGSVKLNITSAQDVPRGIPRVNVKNR